MYISNVRIPFLAVFHWMVLASNDWNVCICVPHKTCERCWHCQKPFFFSSTFAVKKQRTGRQTREHREMCSTPFAESKRIFKAISCSIFFLGIAFYACQSWPLQWKINELFRARVFMIAFVWYLTMHILVFNIVCAHRKSSLITDNHMLRWRAWKSYKHLIFSIARWVRAKKFSELNNLNMCRLSESIKMATRNGIFYNKCPNRKILNEETWITQCAAFGGMRRKNYASPPLG